VHPGALAGALWPDSAGFAGELDNSVANLALARAAATPAGPADDPLVAAEQSIVDGHPLHPCCRSRSGLSAADVLAYAPEHRPALDLPLVDVPPRRWHSTGTGLPPRLPVHPWQWARVRDEYPELVHSGQSVRARPLMTLRTFATDGWHLKTSVDARMTNYVRTVSAAALHNGPVLSALIPPLARGIRGLAVMSEPAGGAVLVDGEPCRRLAVLYRRPPRLRPGDRAVPLAALCNGRPRAADLVARGFRGDPARFLTRLAGLLLPPLLTLLDRGVALEAHGQNLVLVAAAARPDRLLYRDLAGIRVSPARLAAHGVDAPPLAGDIACDDPELLAARPLAAAVGNSLAGTVACLAADTGTEPERLWRAVAAAVPRDTPLAGLLFDRETVPLKALSAMRIAGTDDEVWTTAPNPLAGLA
jgi:staphyloferrin A synthase